MGWQRIFEKRMDDALAVAESDIEQVRRLTTAKVAVGEMTDDEAREAVATAARRAIERLTRSVAPKH